MKYNVTNASNGYMDYEENMKSEGKLLEILMTIELNNQPFLLPPVIYQIPNWLLGFAEWHVLVAPQNIHVPSVIQVHGSGPSYCAITMVLRILEDSPSMGVQHRDVITLEAVQGIIDAFKARHNG